MNYKGTFSDIFEAIRKYPKGIAEDDFVIISDKIHRWSKRRATFVTDGVHVPQPGDNHPVITLFTSLTADGILTDFMGNKWQLAAWAERLATPVITVTDITQDEFPYTIYPRMQNKRWAIADIAIEVEAGEPECEIEYKIIKGRNTEEPYAWTTYDDHFTINQPGDYQIIARAKKDNAYSTVVYSSEFTIEAYVYDTEYTNLRIDTFSYPLAPAVVESGDITVEPVLGYSQGTILKYTDGRTQEDTGRTTTGATVSYSIGGAIVGVSIDSETGIVTAPANTSTGRRQLGVVTVTASLNGKTASLSNSVIQEKRNKVNPSINWNPDPRVGTHFVGDSVAFGMTAQGGGTVTFKDGSNNPVTSPMTLSSTSNVLKYHVEETDNYLSLDGQIVIAASTRETPCVYAFSQDTDAPVPADDTDINNIDASYNTNGSFNISQSPRDIDCSARNTRYCMSWFAVPKGKTLTIVAVESGDNLTGDYTRVTNISSVYDVYVQTTPYAIPKQDKIRLTINN